MVGNLSATASAVAHHGCAGGETEGAQGSSVVIVGIIIHIVGSVGINTGQNLQSLALQKHGLGIQPSCAQLRQNRLWIFGTAMFVSFSILNFVALTLAPASILVPLESVQFVTNVMFGKFVRKVPIPNRMLMGVVSMVCGTALAVLFGPLESFCFSEPILINYWTFTNGYGWWVWLLLSLALSIVCLVLHSRWAKMRAEGRPPRHHQYLMPIAFAVPSALLGGAQMIVHSKTLAELGEIMVLGHGETLPIAGWFFWVEAVLVSALGLFWFYRLTISLALYDPLFIIPLMQACFILFGGVAGGIFFQEFRSLPNGYAGAGGWALYILGFCCVLLGLYMVRTETEEVPHQWR